MDPPVKPDPTDEKNAQEFERMIKDMRKGTVLSSSTDSNTIQNLQKKEILYPNSNIETVMIGSLGDNKLKKNLLSEKDKSIVGTNLGILV